MLVVILVGCTQTAVVLDESMLGGMGDLKLWNTTFLLAEGLEHRRTRVLEGSRMAVDGWRDGRLLKTWENTTFLMAQGLEHRKTRVLEGSSMVVGGEGAALWEPRKTTIWHRNMRFYLGFRYFCEKLVGAGP